MDSRVRERAIMALEIAKEQGCEEVRVISSVANQTLYTVRDNEIDKISQSKGSTIRIELFKGGKYGLFSTNRGDPKELRKFIEGAVEITNLLSPDYNRALPNPKRYFKGEKEDLEQYDPTIRSLPHSEREGNAFSAAKEIYGSDKRIISLFSQYSDQESYTYIVDSQNFNGESRESRFTLSCSSSVAGVGSSKPQGSWYESSLFYEDLKREGVAKRALERALSMIAPRKLPSGRYNMVVENTLSSRLVSPIIAALNGGAIEQNSSFLKGLLGQKVFNQGVQIWDTPHLKRAFGSCYFDSEGVATKERNIIENGIINYYFINSYNSKKLKRVPTIGSPSILNLAFANGKRDETKERGLEELIREAQNGILVTGFNGGNSNSSTGDFSFGVEGFYFESGELLFPIEEMNITGNILTLWNNIIGAGNDPRRVGAWLIPTLLFEEVNFSGS